MTTEGPTEGPRKGHGRVPMPVYEFRCRACHKKTTAIVLARARVADVRCEHCGAADLEKLWSRFATPKSEESRLESLADESAFADVDENDPAGMARAMRRMGEAMGEDLGEDFEQAIEEDAGKDSEGAGDE